MQANYGWADLGWSWLSGSAPCFRFWIIRVWLQAVRAGFRSAPLGPDYRDCGHSAHGFLMAISKWHKHIEGLCPCSQPLTFHGPKQVQEEAHHQWDVEANSVHGMGEGDRSICWTLMQTSKLAQLYIESLTRYFPFEYLTKSLNSPCHLPRTCHYQILLL